MMSRKGDFGQEKRYPNLHVDEGTSFSSLADRFNSLEEVSAAIRHEGLDKANLIFGIDYTLSNRLQGKNTFGGLSLHDVTQPAANPYQTLICILGETLESFNPDDGVIHTFGFGDASCKDKSVFPLKGEGVCEGFGDVLDVYNEVTPTIKLGGPTNFAPLIEAAVYIVKKTQKFHILVICADGQVTSEEATTKALVAASEYPLSIVCLGVGDGPWHQMKEYDHKLPARKFNNFCFVDTHQVMSVARNPQPAMALAALMQIPGEYRDIKRLKLIEKLKRNQQQQQQQLD